MFKLILLLIFFILFSTNYFFWYIRTMPTFKLISHFNFYSYLLDKFENRQWNFTWIEYTYLSWDKNYLIDFTWWILKTDLKYLSPTSSNFEVYIPIIILHTWNNILVSWDKIFSWFNLNKNFNWYTQYISWWNDFVDIWNIIEKWKKIKQTLYLWSFYTYCSMTWSKWIDAYLYDRYLYQNKWNVHKKETKVDNTYVCKIWTTIWEYTKSVCISWNLWNCIETQENTYQSCKCNNKWEYETCSTETDLTKNPDNKQCTNDKPNLCIDYYTWDVNLNNTNCSLSGALWIWNKSKYFLVR